MIYTHAAFFFFLELSCLASLKMRLINVHTFKQADRFKDNRIPPYAILSHRWGENEISYQDFLNNTKDFIDTTKAFFNTIKDFLNTTKNFLSTAKDTPNTGFTKVARACSQAKQTGLDWIWIDTCCIDKTSSAELSTSINSMFRWYRDAQVCFAYLDDVNTLGEDKVEDQILKSRWFTRGWTLQEMLASRNMQFFDANWVSLGSRSQLSAVISKATRISPEHLEDFSGASVAQKMSWIADRVTTEEEDMAYCMLGIFDLNMYPMYGEGKKAFIRLQEMIISSIPDESVFAWRSDKIGSSGLLAPWPDCFKDSGDIVLLPEETRIREAYQMTAQGLRFPAPITEYSRDIYLGLQCWRMREKEWMAVVLFLSYTGGYWKRIKCNEWGARRDVTLELSTTARSWRPNTGPTRQIYIPQRDVVTHRLIDGL